MKTLPDLIMGAGKVFASHPCARFADGTPLKNDVPVIMAEYARDAVAESCGELVACLALLERRASQVALADNSEENHEAVNLRNALSSARALLAKLEA